MSDETTRLFARVRERLYNSWASAASWNYDKKLRDEALAALATLEREAAERETALATMTTDRNYWLGKAKQIEIAHDRLADAQDAAEARVREVEAERDEAYKRVGAADAQRMVAIRKNEERVAELERAEATVARQARVLREVAEMQAGCAGAAQHEYLKERARAVLVEADTQPSVHDGPH